MTTKISFQNVSKSFELTAARMRSVALQNLNLDIEDGVHYRRQAIWVRRVDGDEHHAGRLTCSLIRSGGSR